MPLKPGFSTTGQDIKSGCSSLRNTRGEGMPARRERSAGRGGGMGLVGAGEYSSEPEGAGEYPSISSSKNRLGSMPMHGRESGGEKSGGRGGTGSFGGGMEMMEMGESGGEEKGGGEGGGSSGGGPGERQGESGVEEREWGESEGGEAEGGGGAGSSGGGGLSLLKLIHRGESLSSLVWEDSMVPNTFSRSGTGEPLYEAGDWTFR